MQTRIASATGGALALSAAAVALLAITMGTRSVLGLFLSPLNTSTGLGIATISFAVAVSQLAWGVAQPFCGLLVERHGPARVIAAGSLLAAATGALLPYASSAGLLVAVLAAGGVAATVGSPSLLIGTVSARVAPERRGLVAGIVGAGGPLGQLVLAPTVQIVISSAGWMSAAFALAGLSLVSVPLAAAFRRRDSAAAPAGRALPPRAAALGDALVSPQYWLINATFFVCGLHVFFLVTHLPGVIALCGLPSSVSGAALSLLGLFNIAGSVGAGVVIQRYSMKRTLASLFAARAAGIALFLAAPKTELTVLAFSVWMGITYMAVLPPIAGLVGKLFGAQRLATLLGVTFLGHQVGAFLGAWLGGVVLQATGSYDWMWMLDLTLAGLATATSLVINEQAPNARRSVPGGGAHALGALQR